MPAAAFPPVPVVPPRAQRRRIVLLEENPDHRELIAEFLEAEVEGVEVRVDPAPEGTADLLLVSESWRRVHDEGELPPARHCLPLAGKERGTAFLGELLEEVRQRLEERAAPAPAASTGVDPRLVCALVAAWGVDEAGPLAALLEPFALPGPRAFDPGALLGLRLAAWRERWPGRLILFERQGPAARFALAPGLWLGVLDTLVDQVLMRGGGDQPLRLGCTTGAGEVRLTLEGAGDLPEEFLALARALAGIHGGRADRAGGVVIAVPLPDEPAPLPGGEPGAVLLVGPEASFEAVTPALEGAGRRVVCAVGVEAALDLLRAGCRYELALVEPAEAGPGPAELQRADRGMLIITWGRGQPADTGCLHLPGPPDAAALAELLGC
ncbi:MAG: hypothetical protein Q9Q40_15345 [Acidobacteriota bacterium]|nr:hypothetical protein [Acidobacteriota bacterium]